MLERFLVFYTRYRLVFFAVFVSYMVYVWIKIWRLATGEDIVFKYVAPSQDMMWLPSVYLWEGMNPFQVFIDSPDIFVAPNYAHLLYIIMYPLTLLEWPEAKKVWASMNLFCFIANACLFYRHYRYKNLDFIMVFAFMSFLANGFPNVVAVGQYAGVLSLMLTVGYIYRKLPLILGICLSIIMIKYSFGVPILLAFFLLGYYRAVMIAAGIHLMAVSYFWVNFDDASFIHTLLYPLTIANMVTSSGPCDISSWFRMYSGSNDLVHNMGFLSTFTLIYLAYSIYVLGNKNILRGGGGEGIVIASSVVLSMGTLNHMGYDNYVYLIAFFMMREVWRVSERPFVYLLCVVCVLWYDQRLGAYLGINKLLLEKYDYEITWNGPMPAPFTLVFSVLLIFIAFYIMYYYVSQRRAGARP